MINETYKFPLNAVVDSFYISKNPNKVQFMIIMNEQTDRFTLCVIQEFSVGWSKRKGVFLP